MIEPAIPSTVRSASRHGLRIRGVSARYAPDGPWALDGVDLDLESGRRVALVGPSGAGKSTLAARARALRRLRVGLDSARWRRAARLSGEQVRNVVGLVEQDAHIFDSTFARTCASRSPARPTPSCSLHSHGRAWMTGSRRSRSASTLPSGNTARRCRVASVNGSRLPVRCSPTSRSSSSTNQASISTRRPRGRAHRRPSRSDRGPHDAVDHAPALRPRRDRRDRRARSGRGRGTHRAISERRRMNVDLARDPVRVDEHLPLLVRAGHDRLELPRRDLADDVVPGRCTPSTSG